MRHFSVWPYHFYTGHKEVDIKKLLQTTATIVGFRIVGECIKINEVSTGQAFKKLKQ